MPLAVCTTVSMLEVVEARITPVSFPSNSSCRIRAAEAAPIAYAVAASCPRYPSSSCGSAGS
jgi:hypothetical protein